MGGKSHVSFATHLRAIREKAGLTPEELGERAGVHNQIVRKLESGETTRPRLDTAKKLARALGVSLDRLAEPV